MTDDLPIIQRVLEGDVEAYRILVERHQSSLFCLVGNLIHDPNDRDDIAQDAFLAAYIHLRTYDPRKGAFSTWLMRIARNKCVDLVKQQRPQAMPTLPAQADRHSGPEDNAVVNELHQQLDRALADLPIEQKTAFVLFELQGLSHEEICRIENAPLGTIKSRISRAKEKLRAVFSRMKEPCP